MAGSGANRRGGSSAPSNDSVTALGEPALIRASSIEISHGTILAGRYQIEAVLGRGGSGIVLRAFDRVAQVAVAVKLLKPELATDPRWVDRFSRELRLARQIHHPNVCRVFDIGQADGHWFITMELATAGTLRDQLGKQAQERPFEEKLADVRAVVSGLAAIHEAGIVHRDVKPDNFLRLDDGRLVLSDFGLATNPSDAPVVSIMVGTPHYMAPEVVMGEVATARSDVWAAGVVIHEILLGERPARKSLHRDDRPKIPSTAPPAEAAVLSRCLAALANEPDERPANGAELQAVVEAAARAPARRAGARRRRAQQVLWGATALATAAAGVLFAQRMWRPAEAFVPEPSALQQITRTGQAADWSAGAKVVSAFDERVHCFSVLPGGEAARVIVGTPRRAEDIDLATGKRARSSLPDKAYASDCPQLSPDGRSLLYTNIAPGAPPQIMLAAPDGSNAKPMTNGREALWLPSGEDFIFELADAYVGVFSIPTMKYTLLANDQGQGKRTLYKKAASDRGDLVAVTYVGDEVDRFLEVHALPDLRVVARWRLPKTVSGVHFLSDRLLLSHFDDESAVDRLDWTTGVSERLGRAPGRIVRSVKALPGGDRLIVSNTDTRDVWLFNPSEAPRKVTHDGNSLAAAWSPSGQLLVERQLDDDRLVIFLYDKVGPPTQVTNGPLDGMPSFAGASSTWVYADYARKAIVRCTGAGNCADVLRSDKIVDGPVISPDQQHIAFVTPFGIPRLHLVDVSGKRETDLGATAPDCPPVWASASSLWALMGAGDQRRWEEIDIGRRQKTGRVRDATTSRADEPNCGWDLENAASPFYRRARVITHEDWQVARARHLVDLE